MKTLFDDAESGQKSPEPKQAKPPAWVVRELVGKWGCRADAVKSWGASKAFAILYRYRDSKSKKENAALIRRRDLASALVLGSTSDEYSTSQLIDLITESLTNLDAGEVCEVARLVSSLLSPPG